LQRIGDGAALRSKIRIYATIVLAYNAAMNKYICIVITAGLLAACQKTETVAPAASPTPSSETTTTTEAPATESPTTYSPSP
jgi:hypothetical protein